MHGQTKQVCNQSSTLNNYIFSSVHLHLPHSFLFVTHDEVHIYNFLSILCTTTIFITIKHYLTPRSKLTPPLHWVTITGEYHWHQHHHHQQCHRHRRSYFFGVINLSYKSFYKNREIEAVALVDCPTQLTLTCFVHFEIWCLCLSAICQCFIAAGISISVCLFVWRNTNNLSLLFINLFQDLRVWWFWLHSQPKPSWDENTWVELELVASRRELVQADLWQQVPSSSAPGQPLVKVVILATLGDLGDLGAL